MKSDRGKRKRTRLGRVKQKYATVLLSDWYFSSLSAMSFGSARCLPAPASAPTNAVGRVWASLPTLRPCTGSQRDQTSVWGSSARHTLLPSSFESFNNRLGKGWRTFWCSEAQWPQNRSGYFVLFFSHRYGCIHHSVELSPTEPVSSLWWNIWSLKWT